MAISKTMTIQQPPNFMSKGNILAGKYRIIEPIGKGGMGVVYKAEDMKLERTVALKFLPAESTEDPEARERFVREAKAAAALSHPHICTIHEIGEEENQYFIAMECIEGQSLKQKILKGPLDQVEALDIAIQVAEGLEEAHKKGIVHRDIKPGNIMVTDKGTAKVMDFGLAKVFGASLITKEAKTMGTVAYMLPEQAQGQSVDHRTDIWSLGVVLYEMLTGQLPFKGEYEQSVMYAIVNKEAEPLTKVIPDISNALENVVLTALAKKPADRYDSMGELLEDLRAIAEGLKPLRAKARPVKGKILGVRITVQLIQANPEKHLWAKHYTHTIRDIMNLPEEASRSIIDEIKLKLTEEEKTLLRNARPVNPEAYELVLRGRYLLDQFTEQSLWQSIDFFKKAIEKDPAYAKAYHGLGEAYMCLVTFGFMAPLEGQPKGREYALKAMELDGTLAEPYVGLGWDKMFYVRDWEGAEKDFKRALELNPNSRDAHEFYGLFLTEIKEDWKNAFFHLNRACEIDPLNLMSRSNLAYAYSKSGQKDKAVAKIREVLELAPNFATAQYYLGGFYIEENMYEKAIAEFEKALNTMGETPMVKGDLGLALALSGRVDEARRLLDELKELSKTKYVSSFYITVIRAGLQENDQAFEYFERAYKENAKELVEIRKFHGLSSIRSDPRYADLLKKIGFLDNNGP
jgi:serine/threonine protein kinase/lipoprotein NlpI